MVTEVKTTKPYVATKDKVYRLKRGKAPLFFSIATRDTTAKRLLFYDGTRQRSLRYASNQKSPFLDEQDANPILSPIGFERGMLYVPKTNPILQWFLEITPDNGVIFEEVDEAKNAEKQIERFDMEADAIVAARNLSLKELMVLAKKIVPKHDKKSTEEIRRDVRVYARNYPEEFLNMMSTPDVEEDSEIDDFFEMGLLGTRNNGKEVWWNTTGNKSRMLVIPQGMSKIDAVKRYLKTDEGMIAFEVLKKELAKQVA